MLLKKDATTNSIFRGKDLIYRGVVEKNFDTIMIIRTKPNNIFVTLTKVLPVQTLLNVSAGRFKINVSKKTLKFNLKLILQKVFNSLKSFLAKHKTLIKLIIPINRRVQILKLIGGYTKNRGVAIQLVGMKAFNGCRVKKKRRKKRKKLRIFKNV
jgi:hypothetical protein